MSAPMRCNVPRLFGLLVSAASVLALGSCAKPALTVHTSKGVAIITGVTVSPTDKFMGDTAPKGLICLSFTITTKDPVPNSVINDSQRVIGSVATIEGDIVSIVANDGSKPVMYGYGVSGGVRFVSCYINESGHTFTLNWSNNPPLQLAPGK